MTNMPGRHTTVLEPPSLVARFWDLDCSEHQVSDILGRVIIVPGPGTIRGSLPSGLGTRAGPVPSLYRGEAAPSESALLGSRRLRVVYWYDPLLLWHLNRRLRP